jgi:hypothetical protein
MFRISSSNEVSERRQKLMVDSIQGLGRMSAMGSLQLPQTLTDEQKSQIQTILSKYDSSNVNATDAKAIFQAFKDAGIRPSAGMKETIEAAGFDAEKLRSLGMPESTSRPQGVKKGPPPGGAGGPPPGGGPNNKASASGTSNGVNNSTLQTLQEILSEYDLTDLSEEEEQDLLSTLTGSGLMKSGYLIDLSA